MFISSFVKECSVEVSLNVHDLFHPPEVEKIESRPVRSCIKNDLNIEHYLIDLRECWRQLRQREHRFQAANACFLNQSFHLHSLNQLIRLLPFLCLFDCVLN